MISALIIFWLSICSVILFLLSGFFKALSSLGNALISTGELTAVILFISIYIMILSYLISEVVSSFVSGGLSELFLTCFAILVSLGLVVELFGPLGTLVLEISYICISAVLLVIIFISELASAFIDEMYNTILSKIQRQLGNN